MRDASLHPVATQLAPRLGGRYEHVRELGRGAVGRVVLVEDRIAGGARAAKIVGAAHGARLQWELALLTTLAHPNLASVHELLRIDVPLPEPWALESGAWVLIEELAPGRASDAVARTQPDAASRVALAIALGGACARALAAIHTAGLVHGDVKPANVVVPDAPDDPRTARLVDLGLAGAPGRGPIVGTPAYLAPEAWLGQRSAATDLYALGVSLHRWLTLGGSDASASSRLDRAGPIDRGEMRAIRAEDLPAETPDALRALVLELVRERAEERPASAREVARRIATIAGEAPDASLLLDEPSAEERAQRVAVAPIRGREREVRAIRAAIDAPGVVVVHGPPGAGRTRAIREAVRALQADRAGAQREVPTWIAGAPEARITHASIVHDEAGAIGIAAARTAVREAELDGATLVVVLERDAPIEGARAPAIEVGPIDDDGIAALLRDVLPIGAPSAALREAARAASSALPGRLCRLIAGALELGRDPSRPEVLRGLGREESTAIAIPESCRALVDALAIAGGTLRGEEVTAPEGGEPIARQASMLAASGLATFGTRGLALRADRMARVLSELGAARRRALARALDRSVVSDLARACVDAELGRDADAAARFLAIAEDERALGDPVAAADVLRVACARLGSVPEEIAIARADALRAAGDEDAAIAAIEGARSRPAIAMRAELVRLGGDAAAADALAIELDGGEDEPAIAALCVRARTAWSRGDLDRSEALARSALAIDRAGPGTARAHEVLALVEQSRGDPAGAARHAGDAERAAARLGTAQAAAGQARASSLLGSSALMTGAVDRAIGSYERAVELAERAGERHVAAGARINVGLAQLDAGRLGPAIEALRDGARRVASLHRPRELGRALFNLANAAFLAGDDALASLAARRAKDAAEDVGDRDASAHAAIVIADLAMRAGQLRSAIATLGAVGATGSIGATIDARLAMAHAALGTISEADAAIASAIENARGTDAAAAEIAIAEARVALAAGAPPIAETAAVRAMSAARTFETRVRAAIVGAEAAEACGNRQEAALRLAQARAWLDAAAIGLDPAARARLRSVPAYQRALGARPDAVVAPDRAGRSGRMPIALARRVAEEHRPRRVIEALATAALELCGAERAFVLARSEQGVIDVRCARGLGGALGPEHRPSRSIAARVIDERRTMVSVDAIDDARLDRAASVHAMALRSVLAVPVPTRDGGALALYVDDRLRPGAFDDGTTEDLSALAELGAASLANAERWREERREARMRARRERRLELALDARGEELRTLRHEVARGDPFAALVTRTPAMERVIALASRVAASGVSVLLVGESGTGKEMLARAIHAASDRADRTFVGESCGAIPEALLESTLFGHVRGAFTGADRSKRGLFEIADGGTLFLDAVAETTPATQAKLLRALQEGEIRPVGSERVRRVDVRVIASASGDLRARIASGAFREDLFYRLAVVTIELPPLRERIDDVAALAETFVARHADGRKVRIDDAALAALRAHRWPGNVRELENEVRRALLAAEGTIGVEHLSAELRAGAQRDEVDELDLKARVGDLERALVERALAIHAGNQTRAARALGLSRFGLQKMLKRFDQRK